MSLFAGIYAWGDAPPPDEAIEQIRSRLCRAPALSYRESVGKRFFLRYANVGAYPVDQWIETAEGDCCAAAGNPLRHGAADACQRDEQLRVIFDELCREELSNLRECRGVFALCCYFPLTHRLVVATDSLGSRPLYFWTNDDFLVFSTSLRLIREMDLVPKTLDAAGTLEQVCIGSTLGGRTPYCGVRALRAGSAMVVQRSTKQQVRYHRWPAPAPTPTPSRELLQELYRLFLDAVATRCFGPTAISMLSGGLDSRCVVAALKELGKDVHGLNFSLEGEQDYVYATEYARFAAIPLTRVSRSDDWSWSRLVRDGVDAMGRANATSAAPPRIVFSGDGGSVGMGHVYIEEDFISAFCAGRREEGVRGFLRNKAPVRRIFSPSLAPAPEALLEHSVLTELDALDYPHHERQFYVFLLESDQRCHLHQYWEDIDLNKVELVVPFYDPPFLERIVTEPIGPFLYHRAYHDWLQFFRAETSSVPWQTYPGHVTCPVGVPRGKDQWAQYVEGRRARGNRLAKLVLSHLIRGQLPPDVFCRTGLLARALLQCMHLGNYDYAFRVALAAKPIVDQRSRI